MKKFVFLTSILFLLNACSKEEAALPEPESQGLTINEAKAFYMSNAKHLRTSENDKGKLIFWDDFKTFTDKKGESYIFVTYVDTKGFSVTVKRPPKIGNDSHSRANKSGVFKGKWRYFCL
jgi:hypothetical protein